MAFLYYVQDSHKNAVNENVTKTWIKNNWQLKWQKVKIKCV